MNKASPQEEPLPAAVDIHTSTATVAPLQKMYCGCVPTKVAHALLALLLLALLITVLYLIIHWATDSSYNKEISKYPC